MSDSSIKLECLRIAASTGATDNVLLKLARECFDFVYIKAPETQGARPSQETDCP